MAEQATASYEKVDRKAEVMDTPYDRWISSQGIDVVRTHSWEDGLSMARGSATYAGVAIDWVPLPIGRTALDTHGHTLPPATLETLQTLDGFLDDFHRLRE